MVRIFNGEPDIEETLHQKLDRLMFDSDTFSELDEESEDDSASMKDLKASSVRKVAKSPGAKTEENKPEEPLLPEVLPPSRV